MVQVPDEPVIAAIRAQLAAAADPARAPGMQAYMKSAMPYLGVAVPTVRSITRAAVRADPPTTAAELTATASTLWRSARYREERYAATALLDTRAARALRDMRVLPLLEEFIRDGAWWDHVDEVSHRIGDLLRLDRPTMTAVLRGWSRDADRWIRRSAIIAQLGHKSATDVGLLGFVVEQNLDDREFFITKAIGWALREYARTDADWVRAFVARHDGRIAPLSRREALKRLSR